MLRYFRLARALKYLKDKGYSLPPFSSDTIALPTLTLAVILWRCHSKQRLMEAWDEAKLRGALGLEESNPFWRNSQGWR